MIFTLWAYIIYVLVNIQILQKSHIKITGIVAKTETTSGTRLYRVIKLALFAMTKTIKLDSGYFSKGV
jgi:hypothetical protein